MNRFNPFKGLGTALVTPFRKDGSVDEEGLTRLVEDQIAQGVDFLCVLGTTAETPCLSAVEKRLVMNLVKRVNTGRLPLLLGAGGNHTAEVIDYLQTADLEGFAGVLIVTPYYNKPSQEGLYQHFCAVAAATDLPVVLYNVPGRTGVNLAAETTLRIARDCKNVVAVKEASGKLAQIEQILAGAPEGFEVLSGDDAITLEILTLGGAGVISVVSNAYPARFAEMAHAALAARLPEALAVHRSFLSTYPLLSVDGNPAGIKALLSLQGKIENILRLPLVPVRPETYEALQRTL